MGMRRADFSPHGLKIYGAYCITDTESTRIMFNILSAGFPRSEMRLIDQTLRMFTEPVLGLDKDVLLPHLEAVKEKKALLMAEIDVQREDLMSNPKLAESLRKLGVEPPTKISTTTGKETYAFSKSDWAFTDLLEHPDLPVQALVAARLGVKSTLEETRTERFLDMADRGPMPVPLRYYGAHTGRWSGSDKINLQNITRGSPLNTAITAPEGHVIINCDSSQIEARVLAWLAGQEDLVAAFDRGDDVYKIMASSIYNKPVDAIDKDERFLGKTVVLGAGYGTGWATFQKQLKLKGVSVTDDVAQNSAGWFQLSGNATLTLGASANALTANGEGIVLDDDADCGKVGKAVITTGATVNQSTVEAALAGVNGVFALNQGGAISATDADVECQLIRNAWGE
jgi:DNA polymerase